LSKRQYNDRQRNKLIIPSRGQVRTAVPCAWYLSGNSNDRSMNGSHMRDVQKQDRHRTWHRHIPI